MKADYEHRVRFADWLLQQVVKDARGDGVTEITVRPSGRFWLGRLASEESVRSSTLGERAERLDPCEVGFRLRLTDPMPESIQCHVYLRGWNRVPKEGQEGHVWRKIERVEAAVLVPLPTEVGMVTTAGREEITAHLDAVGQAGLSAEVRAELEQGRGGTDLVLTVVNTSPEDLGRDLDGNLFEVVLEARAGEIEPFLLETVPSSFRYDRRVPAYGINAGVEYGDGLLRTLDYIAAVKPRPQYWDEESAGDLPDFRFTTLTENPVPQLRRMVIALRRWGREHWRNRVEQRAAAEEWPPELRREAEREAIRFDEEVDRIEKGIRLLEEDPELLLALQSMNESFAEASRGKYDSWRPFQIAFITATLPSIHPEHREGEAQVVDTLWFATGGGKTETYLGVVLTAAFFDRLKGKADGITSWARFPLRMLSLQQTQRFADALAAAETVRCRRGIGGESFSAGFLVGSNGTPNRVTSEAAEDPEMPARNQVLLRCPFCRSEEIEMEFDDTKWCLNHLCRAAGCPWDGALPFRIVDEEIYRFLPTMVVGTIDKAANMSMQAAMRGFYAAPYGVCSAGHGYTYAQRFKHPNGCLFPGCSAGIDPLPMAPELYPPALRLQDELHLLRDTLGAVDAHYESLLDYLLWHTCGRPGKVIASSATLEGYEQQVRVLYNRHGRLFPIPGPVAGRSFWEIASDQPARTYVALSPRGVTLEFAADRCHESFQRSIRAAIENPGDVSEDAGVPKEVLADLVDLYGVQVAYGSTLKDVEAVARSFQTEVRVAGAVQAVTLTGRTPLEEVREVLRRLNDPEESFFNRIHLIAASSMISHGVDVDRLNIMTVLGLPLSTAEFIQATSRVGRTHPGLVLALHKIGRERDAGVFRSFGAYIRLSDRLVDPVPITRRSRRVFELTVPGLFQARLYGLLEPESLRRGISTLTTIRKLRDAFQRMGVREQDELEELIRIVDARGPLDHGIRQDAADWIRAVFRALNDPATTGKFVSELFPNGGPMLSLRDVEEQVPVFSRGGD